MIDCSLDKEKDLSVETDYKKNELNLAEQNMDNQMDQSLQQHRYVEADKTDIKNQQVKIDESVTEGFALKDSGTYGLFV